MAVSFVAKGSEERKLQGIAQEIKYNIEEVAGNLSEILALYCYCQKTLREEKIAGIINRNFFLQN